MVVGEVLAGFIGDSRWEYVDDQGSVIENNRQYLDGAWNAPY